MAPMSQLKVQTGKREFFLSSLKAGPGSQLHQSTTLQADKYTRNLDAEYMIGIGKLTSPFERPSHS